jgi:GTP-binding protein HflX
VTAAAVLVGIGFSGEVAREGLEELGRLAESAGFAVAAVITGRRPRPDPATFAGRGKVDEIGVAVREHSAATVIFNHDLSPAQERNLERALEVPIMDRTRLILDIFAERARSSEGKLQVELARLTHLSTRLVRGWTHLERQKGGFGLRGGPGEKQIELDRRLIADRVKLLKDRLARMERQHAVSRKARRRGHVTSVSLVGYTNAGKSTLFNALTHAGAYSADQLFATLDTTTRRVYLPDAPPAVVSDTVGFIADLPHTLVAAFRATLYETVQADLLLHVIDASSPVRESQISDVNKVLAEIGADHIPCIEVFNKIDLTALRPGIERDERGRIARIRLSAATGEGVDDLRQALAETGRASMAGEGSSAQGAYSPAAAS